MAVQGNSLKEPVLLPVVRPAAAQKRPFVKVTATAQWLNYLTCGVARANYPGIQKSVSHLRRAVLDSQDDETAITDAVSGTMQRDRAHFGH